MNVKTELLLDSARQVSKCRNCSLCEARSRTVFGSGNPNADVVFMGEAPGKDEDETGLPFVGRAGKLLTKMIESIGLIRDEVYILNTVKCRPPDNRNPTVGESAACMNYLDRQLEIIDPKIIVVLGKVASNALSLDNLSMKQYREMNPRTIDGRIYVHTYHPAFLLRSPGYKSIAWEDLKKVRNLLDDAVAI